MIDCEAVIARTRDWIERAVIGLNLCPFAKAVYVKDQIRYVVSEATDAEDLRHDLERELRLLADADPEVIETTLLIHPLALTDFHDYLRFLSSANAMLDRLGYSGVIQIASFHPDYRFAGSAADDPANNTNRSPFPMLHLLREASVSKAVAAFPDAALIYERNIETMRGLGQDGWEALQHSCEKPEPL